MNIDYALEQLDAEALAVMEAAARLCMARHDTELTPEHFVAAGLDQFELFQRLSHEAGLYWQLLPNAQTRASSEPPGQTPVLSAQFLRWLRTAAQLAHDEFEQSGVGLAALLYTLASHPRDLVEDPTLLHALSACRKSLLYRAACDAVCVRGETSSAAAQPTSGGPDAPAAPLAAGPSALERFCQELVEQVARGDLDPVLCREAETAQLIDVLCRRKKNNPMILGEAGTGKTALVEGLAWWIHENRVPPALAGVRLYALDLGALKAGASVKGEMERRIKAILDELRHLAGQALLFVDEAHTLLASDGQSGDDIANLLKPALARGEIKVIGATTWREYKKYFEKDPAMVRRFQPITVRELHPEQALHVLRHLRGVLEQQHGVLIRDEAIREAVYASHRYLADRMLPDKALDVLDTACVKVYLSRHLRPAEELIAANECAHLERHLEGLQAEAEAGYDVSAAIKACEQGIAAARDRLPAEQADPTHVPTGEGTLERPVVSREDVVRVIAGWTGIPEAHILAASQEALIEGEAQVRTRVVGQDHVVERVFRRLKAAAAGMTPPNQPQGVFLFTGPSGVGKTEMARVLAETICGHERALVRINMSEYQEAHTVSRLIGSPPGYVGFGEGGVLTEAVRKQPWSVVLLDEFEKAHSDVHSLFYQVFDQGFLNDGEGRATDFRNTIVVLTANLAADEITALWQASPDMPADSLLEQIYPILTRAMPAALIGRMDVLPFRPLDEAMARTLVERRYHQLSEQASAKGLTVSLPDTVASAMVEALVGSPLGVRDLNRLIEQCWMGPVTDAILNGHVDTLELSARRGSEQPQCEAALAPEAQ